MRRRSLIRAVGQLALAALGCALSTATWAAASVPADTAVPLEFAQEVSTKTAHKGDEVKLRVYQDVVVKGKTLIRKDAPATGVVESVKKPGRFGKRGQLKLRLTSVRDVNGSAVPLEPYKTGDRFSASGPGAAGAGLLILGPVGLVGGAFIKGTHVTIEQGTRIQAKVAGGPDN
jgi:hypothetical protein